LLKLLELSSWRDDIGEVLFGVDPERPLKKQAAWSVKLAEEIAAFCHGIEPHPVLVEKILATAKRSTRILAEEEIHRMSRVLRLRMDAGQISVSETDMEFLLPQTYQPPVPSGAAR